MAIGRNSRLERVIVNFVPRTSAAYRLGVRLTGDTRTDVINRYVQIGAYVEWVLSQPGGRVLAQEAGDEQPWPLQLVPGKVSGDAPFDVALARITLED